MIIVPLNNLLALPLLLIAWAIEMMLCIILLRFTLGRLDRVRNTALGACLRELAEPIRTGTDHCLRTILRITVIRNWQIWLIACLSLIIVRQLIVWLAFSLP